MEDINLDCPTRGIGIGICGDVVGICESNGFAEYVRAHYVFMTLILLMLGVPQVLGIA